MLLCRRHRVAIVPLGGISVLLGVMGLAVTEALSDHHSWGLLLLQGVVGIGVLVHVSMSWMVIRRDGDVLIWRGVFACGHAAASRCRITATVTPQLGHEAMYELRLAEGATELVEFASLRLGSRSEARIDAISTALELSWEQVPPRG